MPSQPMMEGGDFEDFKPLGVEDLVFPRFRAFSRAGSRHSRISVLLPEPLTPETTTRRFRGKGTVNPFSLLAAALCKVSHKVLPASCRQAVLSLPFSACQTPAALLTGLRW